MKKPVRFLPRLLFYVAGLFLMALGVAFSVNSRLGVSPVNSLPYVLGRILDVPMGSCVIAVFSCYILAQILLKRREFRWINLTQLVFSAIFGSFVDCAKQLVGDFCFPTYFGRLAMLAVSILFVAVGVAIYLDAGLVNMPMEGMTLAVSECLPRVPFHRVKIAIDCGSVALGALLSILFLHRLDGIREGTVLCAVLVGRLLPAVQRFVRPLAARFCEPPARPATSDGWAGEAAPAGEKAGIP